MTPTPPAGAPAAGPSSTAQASLYQQLCGHLAALKLHDAAEHLPAVLDAARAEGLGLTAALERLLASRSRPPRPGGWPPGCGSPACPPRRAWRTSTTTRNPGSTRT